MLICCDALSTKSVKISALMVWWRIGDDIENSLNLHQEKPSQNASLIIKHICVDKLRKTV